MKNKLKIITINVVCQLKTTGKYMVYIQETKISKYLHCTLYIIIYNTGDERLHISQIVNNTLQTNMSDLYNLQTVFF